MNKKNILIYNDHRSFPVVEQLCLREEVQVITLGEYGLDVLQQKNLSFIQLESYQTPEVNQRINQLVQQQVDQKFDQLGDAVLFEEFQDLLEGQEETTQNLRSQLREHLINTIAVKEMFAELNKQYPVNLVTVLDDWAGVLNVLVLCAKSCDIPTVMILHGTPGIENGRKTFADYFLVSGEYEKTFIPTVYGVDPENVIVTGNSAWDHYYDFAQSHQHIPKNEVPIITFLSTWGAGNFKDTLALKLRSFLAAVKKYREHDDLLVVVKIHPFGNIDINWHQTICIEEGITDALVTVESLDEYIFKSDIVIAPSATSTLIQAAMIGRPGLVMVDEFEAKIHTSHFSEKDCICKVKNSVDELYDNLVNIFKGDFLEELIAKIPYTLNKFCCSNDGQAKFRVTENLINLASDASSNKSTNNDVELPKVLMVGLNEEYGGGVVGLTYDLCRGLVNRGYQVSLLEPKGQQHGESTADISIKPSEKDGYQLISIDNWVVRLTEAKYHVKFSPGSDLLKSVMKIYPSDIVHIQHTITMGTDIYRVAKEAGKIVIAAIHDFWLLCSRIQRVDDTWKLCDGPEDGTKCKECAKDHFQGSEEDWQQRLSQHIYMLNRYVDVITVVSNDLRNYFIKHGVDAGKLVIQHPSVSSVDDLWHNSQFTPRPFKPGTIRLAYVGTMLVVKGAHILLQAVKSMSEEFRSRVEVSIYGGGDAGYIEYLQDIAKEMPDCHVAFMGKYNAKNDLVNIFSQIDAVVIPSIWPETFGMVVEEALASHVPVICTRIGGLQEHFFDNIQGRLFDIKETGQLADIIQEMLENPMMVSSWQRNIRQPRLCSEFIADVDNLYRQTCDLPAAIEANYHSSPIEDKVTSSDDSSAKDADSNQPAVIDQRLNKDYQVWLKAHQMTDEEGEILGERMAISWKHFPSIHLFIAFRPGGEALLADTLDSLGQQFYKGWGLSVVARQACPDPVFSEMDMLEWIETDEDVVQTLNQCIAISSSDWVGVIEVGDRLDPLALFSVVDYIHVHPEWVMIYTDEDTVTAEGGFINPQFKPDVNIDMLYSMPYMGSFCLVMHSLLSQFGELPLHDGVINYFIALKTIESCGDLSIGHIDKMLVHRSDVIHNLLLEEDYSSERRQILQNYFERQKLNASVKQGLLPGTHFVRYECRETPLVSIIIPTKDRLDLLKPCVDGLLSLTDYKNYEILIVDHDSKERDFQEYLYEIKQNNDCVKTLFFSGDFNFSAINNHAVEQAQGDYIVLLNNDTQILQDDWLSQMMGYAMRPDVGIVGARLIDLNEKLQNGGIICGLADLADSLHLGLSMHQPGYMQRAQIAQNFSAVSASCCLMSKALYQQAGGLNDKKYKVMYGDIDLCLRVGELGKKIVWTPHVTLLHLGGQSVNQNTEVTYDKSAAEGEQLMSSWLNMMAFDPAYNKNLTIRSRDASINTWLDVKWDQHFHDRPHILGLTTDPGGCADWRMGMPLKALEKAVLADIKYFPHGGEDKTTLRIPYVVDIARAEPDTLFMQAYVHDLHLEMMGHYRKNLNSHIVYTLDDNFYAIPGSNHNKANLYPDMRRRMKKGLELCDRLIVTTEPLKDAYQSDIDDIVIVPNYLEKAIWGELKSKRRQGAKPRVGWAGAMQHHGDLELLIPVMEATKDEVDWIFFGMYIKEIKHMIKEFHDPVKLEFYPEKLATLNLDLAVAPLERNKFNEGKSNLRLLEFGVLGWPIVCSDIFPYQKGPVTTLPNKSSAWINAIREKVSDLDALAKEGDTLRQWVLDNWMLEDHLEEWLQALLTEQKFQALVNRLTVKQQLEQS
ncbi:MAG: glycosyltransferase [Methylococcales bacterium]|nr:glycosyltransferase [Methylococcales bacterium]